MSPATGIGLRLAATALFSAMALCVRLASLEAPVGQIVFFRSAVALVPIGLYLLCCGDFPAALHTSRPLGHVRRSLLGCLAMFFSFTSLAHLPLASATALGFLAPLLTIPLAMLALGERPGWLVGGAASLGFLGVTLMLTPAFQGSGLDRNTLIGIGAGLAMALTTAAAKVQVKALTVTEAPGAIAFYFALICALAGLATWPFGWAPVQGSALLYLIGAGICGGFAHIAMTEAVARAPVSVLAPFEYTAMLWALLFDLAIFAILPGPLGLSGAFLIVVAAAIVAFADRVAPWFGSRTKAAA